MYIRSRQDSDALTRWLVNRGFPTCAYHAGLSPQQRRTIEYQWLSEEIKAVVCTSAFGLGIDKANVRWVVHFHSPILLAEYLQEIGRAGRDGQWAEALALISEPTGWLDPSDQQRMYGFHNRQCQQYQKSQQLLKALPRKGKISAIACEFSSWRNDAIFVASLLYQLQWLDPFHYQLASEPSLPSLGSI